jgi:ABC-2 type transport system ATP-binding protein
MNVVETRKLCKSYGDRRVLHDVDMQIQAGRLVGFLGPNGAGKTTTLRILLGLLAPGTGDAEIFGKSCRAHGALIRGEIGYLPGDVYLYPNMSGRATLDFYSRVRHRNCADEFERLASLFELELDKRVRRYSTGMRQKLGLIQALMHRPQLLILDEPTSSLDPLVRQKVFDELRNVIDDGRSVLFSSHSLDEVEQLCDEVIILRDGRIVEHQQIDVLQKRALRRIEIVFQNGQAIPSVVPDGLQIVGRDSQSLQCTWSGDIRRLLKWIESFPIDDLIIERPDLNDLFITYYSETTGAQSDNEADIV